MPRNELQTKLLNSIEDVVNLDIYEIAYQELRKVFDDADSYVEVCDFRDDVIEILDDFKEVIQLNTKFMDIVDNDK